MKFLSHLGKWIQSSAGESPELYELELQALEERVLYSAAPVPVELLGQSPEVDTNFDQVDQQLDLIEESVEQLQQEPLGPDQLQFNEDEYSLDPTDDLLDEGLDVAKATGTIHSISGTIFNDESADGLIDNDGGQVFEGVNVRLFRDGGNGNIFQVGAPAVTDATGAYSFENLEAGTYFVAVDSRTVVADQLENLGDESRVWAEQTYGGDGSILGDLDSVAQEAGFLFGGRRADVSDNLILSSNLQDAEHVNRQTLDDSNPNATEVDFGFSFNVVTNVSDGFEFDGRASQGGLRQFIENANRIVGDNHMRFVPAVDPNVQPNLDGDLSTSESYWRIELTAALTDIVSSGTTIDGQAFTATEDGLVELDLNAFNVANGFAGAVGVDGISFLQTDAPELELVGQPFFAHGLLINAFGANGDVSNVEISNLSIHGFGNGPFDAAIRVTGNGDNLTDIRIENNVIGTSPNDLQSGTETRVNDNFRGIYVTGATDGVISNNIIVGNSSAGIQLDGNAEVSRWVISDNEIAGNGGLFGTSDGIEAANTSDIEILRNAIHQNFGNGIDENASFDGSGNFTIINNSIFGNGIFDLTPEDNEGSGIRLFGDGSTVELNYIANNQYDGVTVSGNFDFAQGAIVPGIGNWISRNNFEGNGGDAIDLVRSPLNGVSFGQLVFSSVNGCLLYTSPSPRDATLSRMPSSA